MKLFIVPVTGNSCFFVKGEHDLFMGFINIYENDETEKMDVEVYDREMTYVSTKSLTNEEFYNFEGTTHQKQIFFYEKNPASKFLLMIFDEEINKI